MGEIRATFVVEKARSKVCFAPPCPLLTGQCELWTGRQLAVPSIVGSMNDICEHDQRKITIRLCVTYASHAARHEVGAFFFACEAQGIAKIEALGSVCGGKAVEILWNPLTQLQKCFPQSAQCLRGYDVWVALQ
jgi:hypothetical protein